MNILDISENNNISNREPEDTRASSSSSSIYSSPTTTPTKYQQAPVLLLNNQSSISNEDLGKLKINQDYECSGYKELIKQTKMRMSNKFDQLEKETGLILEHKHDENPINTDLKQNKISNENECSNKMMNSNKLTSQKMVCEDQKLKGSECLFMEKEINKLKDELNLKNEIINKMCKIRSQVESELEDLTASLFEEANKMVYGANVLRDKAEKELYEATLKIDMLTAEVKTLKLLVITSTPSKPIAHNQFNFPNNENSNKHHSYLKAKSSLPIKSPSNYELGVKEQEFFSMKHHINENESKQDDKDLTNTIGEADPVFYEEFQEWQKCPTFEPMNSNFMKRIYDEEIYPVFNFKNKHLTSLVLRSIENNTLTVETVNSDKLPFPKKCALLEVPRVCRYRMKIEDDQWHYISQLCRNRITTVCDLFCYLRYVQDGLVKSNSKDIFWHIMKRRRNIALSKLGFLPIHY